MKAKETTSEQLTRVRNQTKDSGQLIVVTKSRIFCSDDNGFNWVNEEEKIRSGCVFQRQNPWFCMCKALGSNPCKVKEEEEKEEEAKEKNKLDKVRDVFTYSMCTQK